MGSSSLLAPPGAAGEPGPAGVVSRGLWCRGAGSIQRCEVGGTVGPIQADIQVTSKIVILSTVFMKVGDRDCFELGEV